MNDALRVFDVVGLHRAPIGPITMHTMHVGVSSMAEYVQLLFHLFLGERQCEVVCDPEFVLYDWARQVRHVAAFRLLFLGRIGYIRNTPHLVHALSIFPFL